MSILLVLSTFPYAENRYDKSMTAWNLFESPKESLNEYHQIQKQKYDTLKIQNKSMKFEKRGVF